MKQQYLMALDQGTTSSRAILFTSSGEIFASAAMEHRQYHPKPGWVEHDGAEIWNNTVHVIQEVLSVNNVTAEQVIAVGITNQRESVLLWDRKTGQPLTPVIVWQDQRTQEYLSIHEERLTNLVAEKARLPLTSYFSASKIRWLLDSQPELLKQAKTGQICVGTMDSWLLFNLTSGKVHATDVTNASRTMLYNIKSNGWDEDLCRAFQIPTGILPHIKPSVSEFGKITVPDALAGIPVKAMMGDQQAAAFGQHAVTPGSTKNTYGTGCFILQNTGTTIPELSDGMIPTVAYQIGTDPIAYAVEGSIAVAGSGVQWLRDQLEMADSTDEIALLAASVQDTGGVYFVPAFSGLLAPYWDPRARGLLIGLTGYTTRAHIAKAVIDATAYQSVDVLKALNSVSGVPLSSIKVDGGMASNDHLMQFQADLLDITVRRPRVIETTALGAALAAGLGVGLYESLDSLAHLWKLDQEFKPRMPDHQRVRLMRDWSKAVARSQAWLEES